MAGKKMQAERMIREAEERARDADRWSAWVWGCGELNMGQNHTKQTRVDRKPLKSFRELIQEIEL